MGKVTIIDLGDMFSLKDLPDYMHNCPYHTSDFTNCALNNVYKLRSYVEKKYYDTFCKGKKNNSSI